MRPSPTVLEEVRVPGWSKQKDPAPRNCERCARCTVPARLCLSRAAERRSSDRLRSHARDVWLRSGAVPHPVHDHKPPRSRARLSKVEGRAETERIPVHARNRPKPPGPPAPSARAKCAIFSAAVRARALGAVAVARRRGCHRTRGAEGRGCTWRPATVVRRAAVLGSRRVPPRPRAPCLAGTWGPCTRAEKLVLDLWLLTGRRLGVSRVSRRDHRSSGSGSLIR